MTCADGSPAASSPHVYPRGTTLAEIPADAVGIPIKEWERMMLMSQFVREEPVRERPRPVAAAPSAAKPRPKHEMALLFGGTR